MDRELHIIFLESSQLPYVLGPSIILIFRWKTSLREPK